MEKKSIVTNALDKSEIRFWMGIIAVVVSVVLYGSKITTQLAVLEVKVGLLADKVDNLNGLNEDVITMKAILDIK